jgi:N-dimethylarginine dimethylaminohydrolase
MSCATGAILRSPTMTLTAAATEATPSPGRAATRRHYLMCPPTHFEVTYAINPWMDPDQPVDTARAVAQWEALRAAYVAHGHRVDVIEPIPGLPDMVYAANGGVIVGGRALAARFTYAQRAAEGPAYEQWFRASGLQSLGQATELNEGEGDLLVLGDVVLAGTGFRTTVAAHREVEERLGLPVVTLELVDPRFYHLDTALAVLDDGTGGRPEVAYYPPAFSARSLDVLRQMFPDALVATDADAAVLGLNAVSDGRHVFVTERATAMHAALRERGFEPVGIELGELLKGGGSVKCCTLEIRAGDAMETRS